LAKYDLEKFFDEIVISSEVGLIKPEPAVFHYILQKLAV
jgi:HAD superfamily hydrolase (TIGR01549 family)